ncbi:MAG TPA: hypothetical protein VF499_12460, partial [Afipia sp.]
SQRVSAKTAFTRVFAALCAADDRLREAIRSDKKGLDCFVAEPVPGWRVAPIRVLLAMTARNRTDM